LPGEEVKADATWPAEMTTVLTTPGGDTQKALFRMTCRYLGSRVRDGREEAVIELHGRVETPAADRGRAGRGINGVASGAVIVDLATGQTILGQLDSDLAVLFPYTIPNPQAPGQGMVLTVNAGAHLGLTIRRSLTGANPKDLDPNVLLPVRTISLRPHVGAAAAAPAPR